MQKIVSRNLTRTFTTPRYTFCVLRYSEGMIGVFDSGYGGLSVFKSLLQTLPEYSFMYLGDNARAPYGSRSKEVIVAYTKESLEWLFAHGAQLVVLACNTASGEALTALTPYVQHVFPDKTVLGVIDPVVRHVAASVAHGEKVAVIGTISTIRSGRYGRALREAGFSDVVERATPLLAPLVEAGEVAGPMAEHVVAAALSPLTRSGVTTLILGCTHYYFLRHTIEKIYPHLKLFDASDAFPAYMQRFLVEHSDQFKNLTKGRTPVFYTTDEADAFAYFVERTLGLSITPNKVVLGSNT